MQHIEWSTTMELNSVLTTLDVYLSQNSTVYMPQKDCVYMRYVLHI